MDQSLDDILNGTPNTEADELPPDTEDVVTDEDAATPEEEAQDDEGEGDKQGSTPEPEKAEDDEPWTKKAVLDERRKRQELERQLDELRSSKPSEAPKRPDVFDDQDGAFNYVNNQVASQITQARLDMSREMMMMFKDDYEERESQFIDLTRENPELISKLRSHPNPAKFAYDTAIKHEQMKQMENIDEYKAKLEAEIRAKVEAELSGKYESAAQAKAEKRGAIPPSLATQRSASGISTDAGIDKSLEELLGR